MRFVSWMSSRLRSTKFQIQIHRCKRRRQFPAIAIERLEPLVLPDMILGDDFFSIDLFDVSIDYSLDVLVNDWNGEAVNGSFVITAVSASQHGASINIGPQERSLIYTSPVITGSAISTGGDLPFPFDPPVDGGGVTDTTDEWGFDPFRDQFTYTVQDTSTGETAVATVNVEGALPGMWSVALREDYNTAAEFKIDGLQGFSGVVLKTFGEDTGKGANVKAGMQFWQDNLLTERSYGINSLGTFTPMVRDNFRLLDTNNIGGAKIPLEIDDKLSSTTNPGFTMFFIWVVIDQTGGFNAPNKRLPAPGLVQNPWRPDAAQAALVQQMSGPTTSLSLNYIYLNKTAINNAVTSGQLSPAQLSGIKNEMAAIGLPYGHQPNKLERLQIGDLALWEVTS